MKVLWLSPTPSLGENYLSNKPVNGGWIKSLEKGIQDKVDLSVAFYHFEQADAFSFGKTNYYPVNSFSRGRFSKIKRRIFNQLEAKSDLEQFLSIIDHVKPDLIHIHGTEGPFGLIQQYTNIPCVVSVQGCISVILYRYFSGITFYQALRYSRFKNWLFFRTFIHSYYQYVKIAKREKRVFRLSKNLIGRTNWDRRVSSVLSPAARYFHNDEILRDTFYAGKWDKQFEGKLKLFTTCGPAIYKGLETILFCASLLDQHQIDYQWDIAGLTESDDLVGVATKITGKKRSPKVRFVGILNEEELRNKLLATHLYVSPSHIENSPNSLCEAMLLGIPSIATHAGGTASLMKDGEEGILIQDGDPFAMAGAIIELTTDFKRARRMGEKGRQRALKRHDPQIIVEELLRVYKAISEEGSGANSPTSKEFEKILQD